MCSHLHCSCEIWITILSDVPGTDIMAEYLLKKWTKEIIFFQQHLSWQEAMKLNIQLDSSSSFLAVRIMKNWKRMLGEKRRRLLPERRNICEKVHLWSYICTEEWARWLLWAQLEAFPVMAAQPPTLLSFSPDYEICKVSPSGKPNCKSCRKIWFDEVCCWMLHHQHRGRGLRLLWDLQWASSSSLCERTSSAKGRWSGCMCSLHA